MQFDNSYKVEGNSFVESTKLIFKWLKLIRMEKSFDAVNLIMHDVEDITITEAYRFVHYWEDYYED